MMCWYKGLLNNKKESTTQINYNMEKSQKNYAGWKKPDRKINTILLCLYEIIEKRSKSVVTENRSVVD